MCRIKGFFLEGEFRVSCFFFWRVVGVQGWGMFTPAFYEGGYRGLGVEGLGLWGITVEGLALFCF